MARALFTSGAEFTWRAEFTRWPQRRHYSTAGTRHSQGGEGSVSLTLSLTLEGLESQLDVLSGLGLTATYALHMEILHGGRMDLTGFPMPPEFKELFRDWATGKVNFVELADE